MSPEEKKLEKLNKLFELVNEDYATPDDLIMLSETILGILTTERQKMDREMADYQGEIIKGDNQLDQKITSVQNLLTALRDKTTTDISTAATSLSNEIKRVERKIPTKTDLSGLEREIANIKDSFNTLPTELTLNNEAIRDGLELLQGDERLDKSAIKGLDDWEEIARLAREPKTIQAAGVRLLRYLSDVNIEGITNGQTILWNSTTNRFEPGSGGGGGGGHTIEDEGTPLTQRTNLNFVGAGVTVTDDSGNDATVVTIDGGGGTANAYAETPTGLVNSSNVTYTLANTPADTDGVLVLLDGVTQYNGIDYTVSGSTITFSSAPATGSTIFAYYNTFTGGGGGGASAFTDLTDVPASYAGQSGKVAAVKATEDGLEFITVGGTGTVTDVSSANADIGVATGTTTPVLTLNSDIAATASTIVKRDTNANTFSNNYFANTTSTVSAGGTTVLTVASARTQNLTGSSTQTFQLPNATTLSLSSIFEFNNNSSQSLTITNAGAASQYVIPAGGAVLCFCTSIGTANGTWDFHALAPGTVTWSSGATGLVMNSALNTTPQVASGASSSTVPAFIPQRVSNTTGFGGDGTNLYAIIGGTARATISATGITATNLSGTNTGDQTSIVGITGTKAQFDTAVTDGNILYVGDVTTNATHTGDVTGSGALTIDPTAISGKTLKSTLAGTEQVLINDAGTLKRTTAQDIADLGGGGGGGISEELAIAYAVAL